MMSYTTRTLKRSLRARYGAKMACFVMNRFLLFSLLVIFAACGSIKHLPPAENNHTVEVRDSVRIKDSLVIKTKSVYKDYGSLLDTLKITDDLGRGSMKSWVDTTNHVLAGKLTLEQSEDRTKIEYRDREVHDTLRIKEPFPVPVEVKTTPKAYPWSLALNFVFIVLIGGWIYLKVKKFPLVK